MSEQRALSAAAIAAAAVVLGGAAAHPPASEARSCSRPLAAETKARYGRPPREIARDLRLLRGRATTKRELRDVRFRKRMPLVRTYWRRYVRDVGSGSLTDRIFVFPATIRAVDLSCEPGLTAAQRRSRRRQYLRTIRRPMVAIAAVVVDEADGSRAIVEASAPARRLKRRGLTTVVSRGDLSDVLGVVPDGVAEVMIDYDDADPIRLPVRRNFWTASVARSFQAATPSLITWLDASGQVLRRVPGRG